MPREQGNAGERVARSSSKTAKDKTNSATLQASQGGGRREQSEMEDKNNRVRHIDLEKDSEKDSGYSGKRQYVNCMGSSRLRPSSIAAWENVPVNICSFFPLTYCSRCIGLYLSYESEVLSFLKCYCQSCMPDPQSHWPSIALESALYPEREHKREKIE